MRDDKRMCTTSTQIYAMGFIINTVQDRIKLTESVAFQENYVDYNHQAFSNTSNEKAKTNDYLTLHNYTLYY